MFLFGCVPYRTNPAITVGQTHQVVLSVAAISFDGHLNGKDE
jgi:hypothetical protein